MKKIISLLFIIVLSFTISGCGEQASDNSSQKETVKIAYLPITHALPLFVADSLQNDFDAGITVELVKFGSWSELVDALNTGRVDGASVLIELAMKSKEQGIGLKAVALGHTDGNVIISSKDIDNPSGLKGKTVAIPHRQSSHYLLVDQMLKDADMTLDDVNIVELPPSEMPSALATGQIDGYCVAEPFGAKAVALDAGNVLYESGDLWEHSICCALVLNDSFIKDKNETAKELVSLYNKSGKYITSNEDSIYDIANKYLSVDKEVFDISMRWISYDNLAITKEYYEDLVKRVKDSELSDNPPSCDDFVDPTLYQ